MRVAHDWVITITYCLLACLSLVVLTSISPERVGSQALMFIVGLVVYLYIASQEVAVYKAFAMVGYGVSLLLLVATSLLGQSIKGATRWISLGGNQIQGSELVKPLLILSFAYFLVRYPPRTFKNIAINAALFIIPTFLVFRQPDLGTALVLSTIWIAQIAVAGLPSWLFGLGGVAGIGVIGLLPKFLKSYQLSRLESFIDPYKDPLGAGYNVIQSVIAVGSGGIFGKGLGHGTQSHLRFLPERHTDFIFASLAEELGLVGSLFVISLLGTLLFRLLKAITSSISADNRLLLVGVFAYLTFQTVINIGMNIGIAPVTGVTLPLISYGGSSILATAMSLGLAASAMRDERRTESLEIQ